MFSVTINAAPSRWNLSWSTIGPQLLVISAGALQISTLDHFVAGIEQPNVAGFCPSGKHMRFQRKQLFAVFGRCHPKNYFCAFSPISDTAKLVLTLNRTSCRVVSPIIRVFSCHFRQYPELRNGIIH